MAHSEDVLDTADCRALHFFPALGTRAFPASLAASDTSIKVALEPMKLFEGVCQENRCTRV